MNSKTSTNEIFKQMAPVITIDGPTASGKGTISRLLAERLGWEILDSGALYRLLGLKALRQNVALDDEPVLAQLALDLDIRFSGSSTDAEIQVFLDDENVTNEIRTEKSGAAASKVAALPKVRTALLDKQRAFR